MCPVDGSGIVSVSESNQVVNWNPQTGKPRFIWELPAATVTSVDLTPDGRYLARGLADGTVEVYRVAEKRS